MKLEVTKKKKFKITFLDPVNRVVVRVRSRNRWQFPVKKNVEKSK